MGETVLVTGGTGFIGQWCIAELLARGYEVRTTVRSLDKAASVRAAVATVVDPGDRLACVVADLTDDVGWDDAVSGCDYVLHVASPMGRGGGTADPDVLIVPARDGVVRVLQAATAAGVRRVVLTSAANASSPASYTEDSVTDETLWTDPADSSLAAYRRSKTIAERAAWHFVATVDGTTQLTTVLPGAVFGPILTTDNVGSVEVIGRMLRGEMPGTPRIGLEVVDVRDLVDAHLRAMLEPAAAGERFLATGEFLWMGEIAAILRDALGDAAGRVPTEEIADDIIRELAAVSPELASIVPGLGRRNRHTTAKAESVLGWRRRPAAETIVDCARSLLAHRVA